MPAPQITIYSTPTCPYCKLEKEYLREKKFAFKEVNVMDDTQALQQMIVKSGQSGVPVTEINGKIVVGFDKEALKKILKIA